MKQEDSLKKRYLYKLGSKFIGFPISFITSAIIPRGLGLKAYGDYSFITDFFTQLFGVANAGTSASLYTKLSQRQKETGLLRFYWGLLYFINQTVQKIIYSYGLTVKVELSIIKTNIIGLCLLG